jgi:hypothetical protein
VRLLRPKLFPELRAIFDVENRVKDARCPDGDTWARGRFEEANKQFGGKWSEVELSHAELLNVKMHWNTELGIPQDGLTVAEALKLELVQKWIAAGKGEVFPESHIWLAREPLKPSSAEEYGYLKNYVGHLVLLDGVHRLVAWAHLGKQTTLTFVAGIGDQN